MGNCASQETCIEKILSISPSDFTKIMPIGRGGFGQVWKVSHSETLRLYAMKEMNKEVIISKRSVSAIITELKLLRILRNEFIVNLNYAFQTPKNLYLVLDLMSGGDLRFYMLTHKSFSEESLKFLAACITSGLEYLHSFHDFSQFFPEKTAERKGKMSTGQVIHQDLKPENLVFDSQGYLHITDFGTAKIIGNETVGALSGTPGYMAPEIMCNVEYGVTSDYFSLGVILFEIITGTRPYVGKNKFEIRDAILAKQVRLPDEFENKISKVGANFVNKLIKRRPEDRLGFNGIKSVMNHQWFDDFDWERFYKKLIVSPFVFESENNFDPQFVANAPEKAPLKQLKPIEQNVFAGYAYIIGK